MARELSYYSYRDDAVLYHRAVPVLVYLGGFIAIVIIFRRRHALVALQGT